MTSASIDYEQFADLYDDFVTTQADIPWFLDGVKGIHRCLELMSGTGRLSIPLLREGVDLVCSDISPAMLARLVAKIDAEGFARKIVRADARTLPFKETFDCVLLPFQSFAELVLDDDRRRALISIHEALLPGGRFLCTLHNPVIRLASIDGEYHDALNEAIPSGGRRRVRIRCEYDHVTGIVAGDQIFEVEDARGALVDRRRMPLRFALIGAAQFEKLSSESGLEPVAIEGDYTGAAWEETTSPYMLWTLVRP